MQEREIYVLIADYLRNRYPDVIYRFDIAADLKLSIGQASKHKRLQKYRGYPDLFIAKPKLGVDRDGQHFYQHGLFLELKREGTRILKRDGTPVADEHIREQMKMLQNLYRLGYRAEFAVGFDQAKQIIDEYLS